MEFTGEISPATGRHLIRVYLTTFVALVAAALGASMHVFWYPGGVLTWFGILGSLGLIMNMSRNQGARMQYIYMLLVALWEGFSFGPGLRMSLCCYPLSIIVTILTGAAATYGCFTGAAVMAKRREVLFVGGIVSSGLAYFFWLNSVPGIFGPSAVFRVGVYLRAVMFLSYFIFDTHQVLEKAHDGDLDHVRHALVITSDFLVVLAPLLVVLAKMAVRSEDAPATPPAGIRERRVAARRETELKFHSYMLFACGAVSYLLE